MPRNIDFLNKFMDTRNLTGSVSSKVATHPKLASTNVNPATVDWDCAHGCSICAGQCQCCNSTGGNCNCSQC